MLWDTLSDKQKRALWADEDELEMSALDLGIARFREQCHRQPMSRWPASRQLMVTVLSAVVDGIEKARMNAEAGKGMKGCQGWGIPFMVMDPGILALAAIASLLDSIARHDGETSLIRVCRMVGERAQMEWHFMMLKEEAPRLKAVMERRIKKWNAYAIRRARNAMGNLGERWPARTRRLVGAKLVEIVLQESGMFELSKQWETRRKSVTVIKFTAETMNILVQMNEHLELMEPLFMPMLVPPNNWDTEQRGGYRLLSQYLPFIIQKAGSPEPPEGHGPMVYSAVNALQRTEWKVNTDVLDTMQQVWQAGGGWADVPTTEPMKMMQPYPVEGTADEQREWKTKAARLHQLNARAMGRRLTFLQTLEIAQRLRDQWFYFPYRTDFRGRIYPIPTFLQPQGNDAARGLLLFAEGKPLGAAGLRWLKIHFANCWGCDKAPLSARVGWTEAKLMLFGSQAQIISTMTPMERKEMWAEAEDPWQALAAYIELTRAYATGEPESYVCSLPVSVDGSNSGLQHFSAMLFDEEGARLVNLMPSEEPFDIYTDVANVVKREVQSDTQSGQIADTTLADLPAGWLNQGIHRKLCKRGTMTYCYGVTQQGLKDALIADGFVDWAENQFAATQYIGKKIWKAIQECITGAERVMEWLRKCAVKANKAGVLLQWETPAGFKVLHPYLDAPFTRITCLSAEVNFKRYDPDAAIIAHRQRQALPPNFVHSMDACHLMMTVAAGTVHGISSWMMIHDSFGTHACDVDTLGLVLREEFIKLYSIDILGEFRKTVIEQTGEDPGEPPSKGTFDLNLVRDSKYFFA